MIYWVSIIDKEIFFSKLFEVTFMSLLFINIMHCGGCSIGMSTSLWSMWSIWNTETCLWWREFSTNNNNNNWKKVIEPRKVLYENEFFFLYYFSSIKEKSIYREISTRYWWKQFSSNKFEYFWFRPRTNPTLIINTTVVLPTSSSSAAIYPLYQMLFYSFIKYLFFA